MWLLVGSNGTSSSSSPCLCKFGGRGIFFIFSLPLSFYFYFFAAVLIPLIVLLEVHFPWNNKYQLNSTLVSMSIIKTIWGLIEKPLSLKRIIQNRSCTKLVAQKNVYFLILFRIFLDDISSFQCICSYPASLLLTCNHYLQNFFKELLVGSISYVSYTEYDGFI